MYGVWYVVCDMWYVVCVARSSQSGTVLEYVYQEYVFLAT